MAMSVRFGTRVTVADPVDSFPRWHPAIGTFCTLPAPPPHGVRAALGTLSAAFLYPARIGAAASRGRGGGGGARGLRFVLFHQRGGGKPAGGDMARGRSGFVP